MDMSQYDDALVKKVTGVFKNTVYASTDNAFMECAKLNNDKPKVPLVSIWRTNFKIDQENYNEAAFRNGKYTQFNRDTLRSKDLKSLPLELYYQVDCWGLKRPQLDKLVKELLFFFLRYPKLTLDFSEQKFDVEFSCEDCTIYVDPDIQDSTEPSSFEDKGTIYRTTIDLIVKDAIIFDITPNEVPHVGTISVTIEELKQGVS